MTSLDKTWFNPALKLKYNQMQKEFYKNGKSNYWKKLRSDFRKSKKRACKNFYSDFVTDLKAAKPGEYYKMAKKIGAIDQQHYGDLRIESLEGMNPQEQVESVANSFATVSCEYEAVKLEQLPAYLPAEQAPQLNVYDVCLKIRKQKKTKSTLPIDLPESLRKEGAEFLAEPLTNIYNTCLAEGTYPRTWKQEWVTPVPKGKQNNKVLKSVKDVRKIASTSDYSKIFEHFIVKLVLEDISDNINKKQYGGKQGVGTEHLIVTLIDRIRQLQDDPEKLAVILNSYDWSAAFDRLDPTKVTLKCIKLKIRSSIVKILIDFLNGRKMQVKMNGCTSSSHDLIGGSPQGSLIGQLLYIIGSDDSAEDVPDQDKFKYIDDLASLDAVSITDKLVDYDCLQHVPSDISTGIRFLPSNTYRSQSMNESISAWTKDNLMKINKDKSKYMVLSKSKETFATRLTIESQPVERVKTMIHLGVWISEDLTWDKHVAEICKRCYPRIKMLTKLKFVGVPTEDLLNIYCLYIRSIAEYCSTAFHSSLTQKLINKIESIQKTCLKVILDVMYVDYDSALEMSGLKSLHMRREHRSLQFAIKCTKHITNKDMFPLNQSTDTHDVRNREKFHVNKAYTETYRNSTIPYLQRKLNEHFKSTPIIQLPPPPSSTLLTQSRK